jgi:hypothetical protein
MKSFCYLLTTLTLLGACKSFDPKLVQAGDTALNPKLPAMEKQIENNYIFVITPNGEFAGPNPQDVSTLFDKELSEKITNPYTDKKGYIVLKINTFEHRVRMGAALYIPVVGVFTGLPTGVSRSHIEIQIDVLNMQRRLIGSYRGYAETKLKSSIYKNNFFHPGLSRTTYIMSIKAAIQEAKKNMSLDLERLIKELN